MTNKQKYISSAIGLAVLIVGLILFSLFRSPEFPDDVPSSETSQQNRSQKDQTRKLFQQFLASMQEYHGGHIAYRELHEVKRGKDEFRVVEQLQYMNQPALLKSLNVFVGNQHLKLLDFEVTEQEGELYPVRGVAYIRGSQGVQLEIQFEARQVRLDEKVVRTEYVKDPVVETPKTNEDHPEVSDNNDIKGTLVIVIDDLGYSLKLAEGFIALDAPLTYAILPQLPYSKKIVAMVRSKKRDLLLHQPMQPMGWPDINPGPGTLFVSDDLLKKQKVFLKNLNGIPELLGINNHMGSAFTTDKDSMRWFMQQLGKRKLFFLDSKTGPGKISREMAAEFGVSFLARDVFLDNNQDISKTRIQLMKAIKLAQKFGNAIAIGHPFQTTLEVLKEQLPKMKSMGIRVISIQELLKKKTG